MSAVYEEEYFARNYRNYARQNPPSKLEFYRRLIDGATPQRPQRRILDIGCAFGAFLASLDDSWKLFGLDPSQYAIHEAQKRLPQATLQTGSAIAIPYAGPFDAIVSFDCLEHVDDLDAVRSGIAERLADDGAFVFVVPVYDGPTGPVIRLLDRDPTHVHKRERWFWIEWARQAFEVVNWWGAYRYLLPGGFYVHLPTRRFRRWTPAIAVVAKARPCDKEAASTAASGEGESTPGASKS